MHENGILTSLYPPTAPTISNYHRSHYRDLPNSYNNKIESKGRQKTLHSIFRANREVLQCAKCTRTTREADFHTDFLVSCLREMLSIQRPVHRDTVHHA